MDRTSLSVVIVSWQSNAELLACVASLAPLAAAGEPPTEVIIVDNASCNFPAEELRRLLPGVRILVNATNLGFGPAANQGACEARGDIVLFLNPDTLALDNPLASVVQAFERLGTSVVAVAPALVDRHETTHGSQNAFQLRHFPTLAQAARELLLVDRLWPGNPWLRRDRYLDRDRTRPFEVEQPAAAALAVRREVFVALGGFDPRFVPAWFEDVDLCCRLHSSGSIVFWPEAHFAHVGGVAAHTVGYAAFLPTYYRNACRYWRLHHSYAAFLAFRCVLAAGMLLRLALLPLPQRAPRRTAAQAYLRTLWVALRGR